MYRLAPLNNQLPDIEYRLSVFQLCYAILSKRGFSHDPWKVTLPSPFCPNDRPDEEGIFTNSDLTKSIINA